MTERENVIKGLECCEHLSGEYCRLCPYHEDIATDTPLCCTGVLAHDTLALLKTQEPVEPKKVNRYIDFDGEGQAYIPETYDCGTCGKELPWKANYCPNCGRPVKWK